MGDQRRAELQASLERFGVPQNLHDGLVEYVVAGRPVGSFLNACLSDNFVDAMCLAIDLDAAALLAVAKWIYNEAPGRCWGSPGVVKTWRGE
jgi:hypothetical protein